MAKFLFKLQSVLQHRQLLEQEAQRVYSEKLAIKTDLQNRVKAMDAEVQAVLADLRANHLTGTLDLAFLAGHRRFMLGMQRQGIELLQKVGEASAEVDVAQAALAEAAKQRKILEKLKEKQLDRYKADQAAKELAAADEVAMQMSFAAAQEGEL